NQALIERLRQARQSQKDGMPLVPATMALELTSNPFLRLENTTLQKELKTTNELDTLITLYRIYYRETPST
ncbi:MAG: hypothetical protein JXR80_06075, partial [Deltaproteobacteria bacterium]|nr:hypothetical protein [Deltaproteobacteria bacterium]